MENYNERGYEFEFKLVKDWESAPLLICSNAWSSLLPSNWTGRIFSSTQVILQLSKLHSRIPFCELPFNKPMQLVDERNDKSVEITMIPGFNYYENVMFLLKDSYMTTLLAGLPHSIDKNSLDSILINPHLRDAARTSIDRLLIGNSLFLTECSTLTNDNITIKDEVNYFSLQSLIYLLKPRNVISLSQSKLSLPFSVDNLCLEKDFYENIVP